MAFMTAAGLQAIKDTLETWSGLCVDHLAEMENRRKSALKVDAFSKD
jgi:transposase-like protein